nr:polysaccharide biosynthesis C-terminal domain-containing protein [Lacticaseibacillus saniviri]
MGPVLWISALIIMIVSYGSVYANQYTLSRGLFRRYAMPFYVGAVVSVSLNLLVVGKYRAIGAAVVILITELVVCALRVWVVRDELPLATYFSNQWKILVAAVITVLVMAVIPINFGHLFIQLVVQTILLTVIYLAVLMGLREQAMRGLLDRFIRRRA